MNKNRKDECIKIINDEINIISQLYISENSFKKHEVINFLKSIIKKIKLLK